MSRRKQANPKAFKHDSEDENENTAQHDTARLSPHGELLTADTESSQGSLDSVAKESEVAKTTMNAIDEQIYHCQVCDRSFPSLTLFMEHRNNDCCLGIRVAPFGESGSYLHSVSMDDSESSSPSPALTDTSDSPGPTQNAPSPGDTTFSLDEIPFSNGIALGFPYKCDFCEKSFARMNHLKKHEQVHTDQLPFECNFCNRLFKHKRSRDRHLRLHTGDRKYKCSQCDMAFARSDHLKLHLKSHEGKPSKTKSQLSPQLMQCLLCSKSFTNLKDAQTHFTQHCNGDKNFTKEKSQIINDAPSNDDEKASFVSGMLPNKSIMNYQCSFCSEVLQGPVWLAKHLVDHHTQVDGTAPCSFCNVKKFQSYQEMYAHLVTHDWEASKSTSEKRKTDATVNGLSTKKPKIASPSMVGKSSSKPLPGVDYSCPHCAKQSLKQTFESIELLESHINSFHAGKSVQMYSCPKCEAMFPTVPILNDHIDRIHEQGAEADTYNCRQCPATFNNHRSLAKHKNVVHREVESHKPNLSNFLSGGNNRPGMIQQSKFSGALSLKIPQLSKFSKSLKNKTDNPASLESSLSQHELSSPKDNQTGQIGNTEPWSPQTCERCNATFKEPWSYEVHMKIHEQVDIDAKFVCQKCGAVYPTEEELETHAMNHYLSLSTEYGCMDCMKLFNKPDELQKHLMDIHAHHLYKCSLCSEVFDSKVNIQVHFAVKHSNECKIHKCAVCKLIFHSEMEWRLHVKVSHLKVGKPYRCLLCKESFVSDDDLQTHLATHSKQFKCLMCEEAFHVEFLLDRHVQLKHSDEDNSVSPPTNRQKDEEAIDLSSKSKSPNSISSESQSKSSSPKIPMPKKTYLCEICDAVFSDVVAVQEHRSEAHQPKSSGKGSTSESSQPQSSHMTPLSISSQQYSRHLCLYCRQSFKSKSDLERHVRIHITANSLKCNICDEVFPSTTILAEHKLQHCKVPQGNICVVCKTALKNEEHFHIHSKRHGVFGSCDPCVVCCQTLASSTELKMHGKYHFQANSAFFSCCVCLKSFESKDSLVFKLNAAGRAYYVCKPCYTGDESGFEDFNCSYCSKAFRSKQQFEVHLTTVQHSLKVNSILQKKTNDAGDKFACFMCARYFPDKQCLVTQVNSYNKEVYTCTTCYNGVDVNKNHTTNGESKKPRCKHCSVKFETTQELDSHSCHKKAHPCCVCKATYWSVDEVHTKLNSLGQEYYVCKHCSGVDSKQSILNKCPKCNLVFPTKEQLAAHVAVHERNVFQCRKCQQSFETEAEIAEHVATHVMQEGNAQECKLCSSMLDSPAKLQLHLIQHSYEDSPMACCICKTVFQSAVDIQHHVLTHPPNTRPYACTECNHSFYFSAELQNHAFAHETSKDTESAYHVCPHCLEMFSSLSLMEEHVTNNHSTIMEMEG